MAPARPRCHGNGACNPPLRGVTHRVTPSPWQQPRPGPPPPPPPPQGATRRLTPRVAMATGPVRLVAMVTRPTASHSTPRCHTPGALPTRLATLKRPGDTPRQDSRCPPSGAPLTRRPLSPPPESVRISPSLPPAGPGSSRLHGDTSGCRYGGRGRTKDLRPRPFHHHACRALVGGPAEGKTTPRAAPWEKGLGCPEPAAPQLGGASRTPPPAPPEGSGAHSSLLPHSPESGAWEWAVLL